MHQTSLNTHVQVANSKASMHKIKNSARLVCNVYACTNAMLLLLHVSASFSFFEEETSFMKADEQSTFLVKDEAKCQLLRDYMRGRALIACTFWIGFAAPCLYWYSAQNKICKAVIFSFGLLYHLLFICTDISMTSRFADQVCDASQSIQWDSLILTLNVVIGIINASSLMYITVTLLQCQSSC